MKKELKQFKISREGFKQLGEFDHDLLERARTVVMWYLEASYGRTSDKQSISLQEAAVWSGFKVSLDGNSVTIDVGGLNRSDAEFYLNLFLKFKSSIETLKIDENDELGLMDETIQIANIMLKYRHVIALRRKKKGILERVMEIFA